MSQSPNRATEQLGPVALSSPPGTRLMVIEGPDEGLRYDLVSGAIEVGAGDECEIQLTDTAVSTRHIAVEVVTNGVRVTDLGSTNGTYYLQTRLDDAVLAPGAVLSLGRTRLCIASLHPPTSEAYSEQTSYGAIIGSAPPMRHMYAVLESLEASEGPVLMLGPSGAGKSTVARAIHDHSARKDKPYVAFNCGSVGTDVLELHLMGHSAGIVPTADETKEGLFEAADGGTLFLNEINALPSDMQRKVLNVMETSQIKRVGEDQQRTVNTRLIAGSSRDLKADVEARRFRRDMYSALSSVVVRVPALKDRREDIPELIQHFLADLGHPDVELHADTWELLTSGYGWPGNVRELRGALARIVSMGSVPSEIIEAPPSLDVDNLYDPKEPYAEAKKRVMDAFERDYLVDQLERAENNLSRAARNAGMDRSYFKRLLKRHDLLKKRDE